MADVERRPLLAQTGDRRLSKLVRQDEEASSIMKSHVTVDEMKMSNTAIGERLPYNDYTTIDWLHDLVKDSYRLRYIHSRPGLRFKLVALFDSASGWVAAALIGGLTACVAFGVDTAEATVSDWKLGYCKRNPLLNREACCEHKTPFITSAGLNILVGNFQPPPEAGPICNGFYEWKDSFTSSFVIFVAFSVLFGTVASTVTMFTKRSLPSAAPDDHSKGHFSGESQPTPNGKAMYMSSSSGIPELKTILSGFVIPNFLDFKVLFFKALGAIFAVASGMALGKEGPFVHISACVGYLVAKRFPKYRDNGRKMREMLSASCAAGLSVAFGAPIGGVLFSYEEISTYFPRKVLWRAFLCSLTAAVVLKALNPTGTGKLVLFETNYGTSYGAMHYLVFAFLGVAGGIFGGLFCKLNFYWSKWFRTIPLIKNYPVLEVAAVALLSALLQYPNPLTREPGEALIGHLLVDCRNDASATSWICEHELASNPHRRKYIALLAYGTLTKALLTIITFGIKVPSGVIIPALDAGALFGRLLGQAIGSISPGIFAMVGAAAFLAGVSRMTISLCVIMFELTGELEYIVPHMLAILVAKWTADAIGKQAVYDIAQTVLGHPFLDLDHALHKVQKSGARARAVCPPRQTMEEVTVHVPPSNKVPRLLLETKLAQLRARGLLDAGLVLVQSNGPSSPDMLQGYISESELAFGLASPGLGDVYPPDCSVRLLGEAEEGDYDLSGFVDRTPAVVCAEAPMEYVLEIFGKLGLRCVILTEEGSGAVVGVVIKKRLVGYLEGWGEE